MTVLASVSQQTYTPRTIDTNITVPAGQNEIRAKFTKVAWPEGQVGSLEVFHPDGHSDGVIGLWGGAGLARDGSATVTAGMRTGDDTFFAAGTYKVRAIVMQTVTTAITVESV